MWLERLFAGALGRPSGRADAPRRRLDIGPIPVAYAIGDVHGCLDELLRLEQLVLADAQARGEGPPLVIMLGDYVDRGPRSADVLDHLNRPPEGFERLCLAGNHDVYFHRFLGGGSGRSWYRLGGAETLRSYGIDPDILLSHTTSRRKRQQVMDSHVPDEHRAFLAQLPVAILTPDWLFVHAGLRAGVAFERQRDADLIETRDAATADYSAVGRLVVHGHTVVAEPVATATTVAVDTGACLTGRLTAVRLQRDVPPRFITAQVVH